jgi:hypothetical protein
MKTFNCEAIAYPGMLPKPGPELEKVGRLRPLLVTARSEMPLCL